MVLRLGGGPGGSVLAEDVFESMVGGWAWLQDTCVYLHGVDVCAYLMFRTAGCAV